MSGCGATVLLVDDDPVMVDLLIWQLRAAGYETVTASNGADGLRAVARCNPDVVVTDVMMPVMTGWELCERLRAQSDVPIIMLTAKDDEADKLRAFRLGADDYVTVPCSFAELVSRIGALLSRIRRAQRSRGRFVSGDLSVDIELRRVAVAGQVLDLSSTEFRLLCALVQRSPRPVSLETIVADTWGESAEAGFGQVKHYIWALRRKIESDPAAPKHLLTERGFGYRLE